MAARGAPLIAQMPAHLAFQRALHQGRGQLFVQPALAKHLCFRIRDVLQQLVQHGFVDLAHGGFLSAEAYPIVAYTVVLTVPSLGHLQGAVRFRRTRRPQATHATYGIP